MVKLGTFEATTTQNTLGLDPRREYTIVNRGETVTHTASDNDVYLGVEDADADGGVGENKYILEPREVVVIGPGLRILKYKSAAGAPCISVSSSVVSEVVRVS